jgi:hypothetical protein
MTVKRYRTKPCEIEAIQWTGKNLEEIAKFVGDALEPIERRPDYDLKIRTPEGVMKADRYDHIVKGLIGEFYPVKPEAFEKKYEAVECSP